MSVRERVQQVVGKADTRVKRENRRDTEFRRGDRETRMDG